MLYINGAQGEGGGQILRSSLSLAMVTGTAIKLEQIRAGRSKPGLMRQHLACVKAAQMICDAEVSGAKIGSTAITFKPNAIRGGDYEFAVGSAGSTTLIFQTVLPALARADKPSRVVFQGGTHNMAAPSFDFIKLAFVPVLTLIGIKVDLQLQRHGFYPQGGGQWQATIHPAHNAASLDLRAAGDMVKREAVAVCANLPDHVAQRELETVRKKCDWTNLETRVENVNAWGSGNILSLRLHYPHFSEVIEHVGKVGLSAENVARAVVKDARRYLAGAAVVGEHLADQLLLPLALTKGGVFRTLKPTLHCETNRDVIQMVTQHKIRFEEITKDLWEIRVDCAINS